MEGGACVGGERSREETFITHVKVTVLGKIPRNVVWLFPHSLVLVQAEGGALVKMTDGMGSGERPGIAQPATTHTLQNL